MGEIQLTISHYECDERVSADETADRRLLWGAAKAPVRR